MQTKKNEKSFMVNDKKKRYFEWVTTKTYNLNQNGVCGTCGQLASDPVWHVP